MQGDKDGEVAFLKPMVSADYSVRPNPGRSLRMTIGFDGSQELCSNEVASAIAVERKQVTKENCGRIPFFRKGGKAERLPGA